jgi:co-chaperonin GroES (HSP10)
MLNYKVEELKAFGRSILIEPIEQEELNIKGIYVPNENSDQICQGLVLAVGSDVCDKIKPQQTIFFKKWTGLPITTLSSEKDYKIIELSDIVLFL